MPQAIDDKALARQPLQERAKMRFERVLETAETLLLESGLGGFSIPTLAERLEWPRATIYKFFPTPYAIFNELVRRDLQKLEDALFEQAARLPASTGWEEGVSIIVTRATQFYNQNPVAQLLILGGPVSDDSYRAQELTIQRLGALGRNLLSNLGVSMPLSNPDVASLAIDIGATCFRHSVFLHGRITPAYRDEAIHAMSAYLQRYADDSEPASRRKRR